MKCPVDQAPLQEVERGGFKLAACTECHGLWLTRESLKQAFASPRPPEKLDESELQPPLIQPAKTRNCPSCSCQLAPRWLHGIEIDVCQQCHGVWLDAGELRAIVASHRQRQATGSAAGLKATADRRDARWYDALDIPADADFLLAIGNGLGDLAGGGLEASKAVAEFLGEALSLLDW